MKDTLLLKIGTSDTPNYWDTVDSEIERAVSRSYYFCNPGTIKIYVFKGASSKSQNDALEECLRYKYKPASEEVDITSDSSCGKLKSTSTNLFCKGGCSLLGTLA